MRPLANFALHATLAAVLAALATTSAAADERITYLALGDSIPAGSSSGRGKHIEILSYHFGPSQAAGKVEYEWKVEEGESAPPPPRPPTVTLKRGMTRSAGGDPDRPIIAGHVPNASATGANEKLTVGGGRTEAGQATGKRQHLPIRARAYYDQPLAKGSVWVRVASPWAACRVGARYPSIELGSGAKRHVLQEVTVASCGGSRGADNRPTEEIAFTYNKVTVRGWDPKKKQE